MRMSECMNCLFVELLILDIERIYRLSQLNVDKLSECVKYLNVKSFVIPLIGVFSVI